MRKITIIIKMERDELAEPDIIMKKLRELTDDKFWNGIKAEVYINNGAD